MINAVVFDLDGVLVESESAWDAARRGVVSQSGGRWRDDAARAMMGMSAPEWSRYLRDELEVPLEPGEIEAQVVARVLERYRRAVPVLPGAAPAVRRLRARWRLGLASSANRPVIDAALDAAGVAECFDATVAGEEVARGKPAPDVYLAAAEKLGADPRDAVAIEDSSNGLRAAAAAGMKVVAIPNREFPPSVDALALAALVLDSLDQLTPEVLLDVLDRGAPRA